MKIIGIDPGLASTGYAVVSRETTGNYIVHDFGCIRTKTTDVEALRLLDIYRGITALISEHNPSQMTIEHVFFNKNVSSCLSTAAVVGVCKLAAAEAFISVGMVKPQAAKSAVTGSEHASKEGVKLFIEKLTGVTIKNAHAADAVAIAIAGLLRA